MVSGKHKSRSRRRVFVKSSSKTKIHYRKRKPSKSKCGKCKTVLKGVPNVRAMKLKRMNKTKKRPQRPFGGVLCSKCTRLEIKRLARK